MRSFVILTAGSCGDAHLTEPDDESAEPEVVLGLTPPGALSVFTDGFRHLQGLAVNATTLFAATRGRQSEPHRPRSWSSTHASGALPETRGSAPWVATARRGARARGPRS